jgi:hypothetical protein
MKEEYQDAEKENFVFRLIDKFDLRYVKREGTYQLLTAVVFGCCGLILTAFFVGILALVFHISPSL